LEKAGKLSVALIRHSLYIQDLPKHGSTKEIPFIFWGNLRKHLSAMMKPSG
jgi:hypothetical protein